MSEYSGRSRILICRDTAFALRHVLEAIRTPYALIDKDGEKEKSVEFLVEDAHEAIGHAYIASEKEKFVIARAENYNTVSQNALLKVLEEPPRNITFILIAPTKSVFLPTIRSRMPMKVLQAPKPPAQVSFDFSRLDVPAIFDFLKSNRYLGKEEAKALVEQAFDFYGTLPAGRGLEERERLELFDRSYRLLNLNANPGNVLTTLFLTLLEVKNGHSPGQRHRR